MHVRLDQWALQRHTCSLQLDHQLDGLQSAIRLQWLVHYGDDLHRNAHALLVFHHLYGVWLRALLLVERDDELYRNSDSVRIDHRSNHLQYPVWLHRLVGPRDDLHGNADALR